MSYHQEMVSVKAEDDRMSDTLADIPVRDESAIAPTSAQPPSSTPTRQTLEAAQKELDELEENARIAAFRAANKRAEVEASQEAYLAERATSLASQFCDQVLSMADSFTTNESFPPEEDLIKALTERLEQIGDSQERDAALGSIRYIISEVNGNPYYESFKRIHDLENRNERLDKQITDAQSTISGLREQVRYLKGALDTQKNQNRTSRRRTTGTVPSSREASSIREHSAMNVSVEPPPSPSVGSGHIQSSQ